jgi:hypothetical protein
MFRREAPALQRAPRLQYITIPVLRIQGSKGYEVQEGSGTHLTLSGSINIVIPCHEDRKGGGGRIEQGDCNESQNFLWGLGMSQWQQLFICDGFVDCLLVSNGKYDDIT